MKLYLIRHGETELNRQKVYYGATDCALTDTGRKQAQALAAVFAAIPLELAFDTPLRRAKDTADLVLQGRAVPRRTEPRLRELDFGAWEGKGYRELQGDPLYEQWCRDWKNTRPPHGESFADMAGRVGDFKKELLERQEEAILVVSHHAVLQQLTALLLQGSAEGCWHYSFTQGCYSLLEINDGFAVLKGHNLAAV